MRVVALKKCTLIEKHSSLVEVFLPFTLLGNVKSNFNLIAAFLPTQTNSLRKGKVNVVSLTGETTKERNPEWPPVSRRYDAPPYLCRNRRRRLVLFHSEPLEGLKTSNRSEGDTPLTSADREREKEGKTPFTSSRKRKKERKRKRMNDTEKKSKQSEHCQNTQKWNQNNPFNSVIEFNLLNLTAKRFWNRLFMAVSLKPPRAWSWSS